LILNGEIFNYAEIRNELLKKKYSFVSNSDTEVLIKAFHCWGVACVDLLIGMFAFAIYDKQTDELFVFRDRLGVKPLYISQSASGFFFASELKAMKCFDLPLEINLDAVHLFFRFGYIPGEMSIFKSIEKLGPGTYLQITRSGVRKVKYWQP